MTWAEATSNIFESLLFVVMILGALYIVYGKEK